MDCAVSRLEMVSFYFGDVAEDRRLELEEHIASCPECLQSYFALKRSVEVSDRPSAAAKSRLRAAVLKEVEPARRGLPWLWWERPLAVVLATASVLFAVAVTDVIASTVQAPSQIMPSARTAEPTPGRSP